MPQLHINQSKHNSDLHGAICDKFPEHYNDWKITVLFYTALHCIKAYFKSKNIDIGDTHVQIEKSINPLIQHAPHKVNQGCWANYKSLYRYSHTARYDGISDMLTFQESLKEDHKNCKEHLIAVKKYVTDHGLKGID